MIQFGHFVSMIEITLSMIEVGRELTVSSKRERRSRNSEIFLGESEWAERKERMGEMSRGFVGEEVKRLADRSS